MNYKKRKVVKTNKDGVKTRIVFDTNKDQIKKFVRKTGSGKVEKRIYDRGGKDIIKTKYSSEPKDKSDLKITKKTTVSKYSPEYTGDESKDILKKKVILRRVKTSGNDLNGEKLVNRRKTVTKGSDNFGSSKSKTTIKDGVKTKQKFRKDGTVKKTVTRTPGGVEKEIERGNKRIEVQKYKDEGVKNRTVINMKKAKQNAVGAMAKSLSESAIKGAISGSAFKNLPSSMVKEAMKPDNNVIMNKIMKATDNAMKEYGVEKIKNKK
tara:strand:+ start:2726 stop:3520 length:795 start_codon:yes stop_codon:yes gene_type:complete